MRENLGKIAAQIAKAARDMDEDPMNDYAGFVPDCTPHLEAMARDAGYANLAQVREAVEERTSARWVFFHLGF